MGFQSFDFEQLFPEIEKRDSEPHACEPPAASPFAELATSGARFITLRSPCRWTGPRTVSDSPAASIRLRAEDLSLSRETHANVSGCEQRNS